MPMQRSKILALALLGPVSLAPACRRQPKPPDVGQLMADLASSDSEKSGKASLTILGNGELAVPGLTEMLENSEPRLRARAATTLWGLGPNAKAAAPALAKTLGDADVDVRRATASALGNMGAHAEPAVQALIRALRDSDSGVRQLSAKALGEIGPAARAALPALDAAARFEGLRPAAEEARRRIQAR
jgi:HEAT repeat protein